MKTRTWGTVCIFIGAAVLLCACTFRVVRGSGTVITEARDVGGFDAVELAGMGQMIIVQGDEESLTIQTDDNLMPYIETEIGGRTLTVKFADNTVLIPTSSIVYRLNVIDLAAITSAGAGTFSMDALDTDRLRVGISGAGDVNIGALTATEVSVDTSGAGRTRLAGQVKWQEIVINGLGGYDAPDLESQVAEVTINGGGTVTLWARDTLDVAINGAGTVRYYGSPAVRERVGGAGNVRRLGEK